MNVDGEMKRFIIEHQNIEYFHYFLRNWAASDRRSKNGK